MITAPTTTMTTNDYDDGGYDDGGYDYDSSDNEGSDSSDSEGDDDYGAHESEGHDAGEAVVQVEEGTIGFAVFVEVKDGHHDHGSTVDGGGHVECNGFFDYASSDEDNQGSTVSCGGREECNGFFDYAHSEDGYQSDDDNQVPCYGVVSPGPSYVRDRGDHPALYSPSPYAPSARSGVQNYPSSHGNYHGPGTWYYEMRSTKLRRRILRSSGGTGIQVGLTCTYTSELSNFLPVVLGEKEPHHANSCRQSTGTVTNPTTHLPTLQHPTPVVSMGGGTCQTMNTCKHGAEGTVS